jgi:hypothetical protein
VSGARYAYYVAVVGERDVFNFNAIVWATLSSRRAAGGGGSRRVVASGEAGVGALSGRTGAVVFRGLEERDADEPIALALALRERCQRVERAPPLRAEANRDGTPRTRTFARSLPSDGMEQRLVDADGEEAAVSAAPRAAR